MSTVTKHYCDRCQVEMTVVKARVEADTFIENLYHEPTRSRVITRDLCSECLSELRKWLLTPPADRDTVVATDNP